jgi:hypothetical protein
MLFLLVELLLRAVLPGRVYYGEINLSNRRAVVLWEVKRSW